MGDVKLADKIKAEEASKKAAKDAEIAKAEKEENDRIAREQKAMDEAVEIENAELKAAADKAAAEIERQERDESDNVYASAGSRKGNRVEASKAAANKIRLIAMSYPLTTPDEHTIFGFGGHRFTLGDLRDLVQLR